MLCSLSYTKFMNFLITDNFIDEMDENNNSLLKHSFVVTFFSLIYDFIIFFIDDVYVIYVEFIKYKVIINFF